MYIIGIILTSILSSIVAILYCKRGQECGQLDVDPKTGYCRVTIYSSSKELTDNKIKRVVFKVNHDTYVPPDEDVYPR